jgi:hypothetical protein
MKKFIFLISIISVCSVLFFKKNIRSFFNNTQNSQSLAFHDKFALVSPQTELKKAFEELFAQKTGHKRAVELCNKILKIVKNYKFNNESVVIFKEKLLPVLKTKFGNDKEVLEMINKIEKNIKPVKLGLA